VFADEVRRVHRLGGGGGGNAPAGGGQPAAGHARAGGAPRPTGAERGRPLPPRRPVDPLPRRLPARVLSPRAPPPPPALPHAGGRPGSSRRARTATSPGLSPSSRTTASPDGGRGRHTPAAGPADPRPGHLVPNHPGRLGAVPLDRRARRRPLAAWRRRAGDLP